MPAGTGAALGHTGGMRLLLVGAVILVLVLVAAGLVSAVAAWMRRGAPTAALPGVCPRCGQPLGPPGPGGTADTRQGAGTEPPAVHGVPGRLVCPACRRPLP